MVSVPSSKTGVPVLVSTYKLVINCIPSEVVLHGKEELKTGLNPNRQAINSKEKFFIFGAFGFWI